MTIYIAAFFAGAIIFFWAFTYLFFNSHLVFEHRALVGGPLFAVGFAPFLLLYEAESGFRLRVMAAWIGGMVAGIAVAGYLFADQIEVPA